MPYSKDTYLKAESILSERRNKNSSEYEKRRNDFFLAFPRAKEIERLLCTTATAVGRAVLSGENVREQLEKLKKENLALQQELRNIITGAGFSENYLDPIYDCKACKDTGYIDGKMCECLKTLLKTITYEQINALSPLSLSSFDNFSLEYYPEASQTGGSPREKMSKIFSFCKEYARDFSSDSRSILMQGGTGLGKTHLALAIANEVIAGGYGVIYCSAPSIVQKLESEHFSKYEEEETLKQLNSCDLLILDDLGTEFSTQFSSSILYNIFNTRISSGKPIIISTNLELDELERQYSARFVSRVMGSCVKMKFVGNDIRFNKKGI